MMSPRSWRPSWTRWAGKGDDCTQVTLYEPSTRGAGVEPFLHNTDARLDAVLARPGL